MRRTMERLKLVVNEEKTRTCGIPQGHFDFLGYTFGRCHSTKTGRAYIGTCPSKTSVQRLTAAISAATTRRTTWMEAEAMVEQLNRKLVGWAQYFCLGARRQGVSGDPCAHHATATSVARHQA